MLIVERFKTATLTSPSSYLYHAKEEMDQYIIILLSTSIFSVCVCVCLSLTVSLSLSLLIIYSQSVNSGELQDSNINRSPSSHLYNPKEDRDQYVYHNAFYFRRTDQLSVHAHMAFWG